MRALAAASASVSLVSSSRRSAISRRSPSSDARSLLQPAGAVLQEPAPRWSPASRRARDRPCRPRPAAAWPAGCMASQAERGEARVELLAPHRKLDALRGFLVRRARRAAGRAPRAWLRASGRGRPVRRARLASRRSRRRSRTAGARAARAGRDRSPACARPLRAAGSACATAGTAPSSSHPTASARTPRLRRGSGAGTALRRLGAGRGADQRAAGHLRRLRQAQEGEQGRRHVGELAVGEPGACAGRR